jgi:hypothetical protein
MMALGTIIDQPVAAVTLGVGAMLVGVAWRSGEGPTTPPLGTMVAAALMLALSTVVGTVTGRWDWLHLGVLFVFCLIAGLATAIGRRGAVVGTQTLIAFIVFGRFPESVPGGLRLASLVLAGGAAQTLFAALVASPLAWRHQRYTLADAYRQLAALARRITTSGVRSAEDFDAAERALATPALFGDPQLQGLVTLVAEGRRIRLELLVLSAAVARGSADEMTESSRILGEALELIATTLTGGDPTALESATHALKRWSDHRESLGDRLLEVRLAALGGQVRAAARQAVAVSDGGAQSTWGLGRPSLGSVRRLAASVTGDLDRMRENANLASAPGRHALRLAIVVAGTELLTQRLAIPRGYWAVVAAATVLRPNYGATFTRGAERVIGSVSGAVLATLIAYAIDPSGWGLVVTIGLVAALTYTVFAASFTLGVAGLTALIVFLLHTVTPDSGTIALDRGLDTVIGGAIALGVMLAWPTWSGDSLPRSFTVLLAAQRDYLAAVVSGLLSGTLPPASGIAPLARHVRIAYSDADAALLVARDEPDRDQFAARDATAALAALRRVTYGIHALRLASLAPPEPHPELAPVGDGLEQALGVLGRRLSADPQGPAPLPPLRDLYRAVAAGLGDGVGVALDELVDAIDSAAVALES